MASLLMPTFGHAPDPAVPMVTPDEHAKYDDTRTQKAVEWVRPHRAVVTKCAGDEFSATSVKQEASTCP